MYLSITDFIAQVSLFFSKFPEDSKDAILKPVQYIKQGVIYRSNPKQAQLRNDHKELYILIIFDVL